MFKIDLNLDAMCEANEFIHKFGTTKGRALANLLGFKGKGSARAATALSNYAWNKQTAIGCREHGKIQTAIMYEDICDKIYTENIQPSIECW